MHDPFHSFPQKRTLPSNSSPFRNLIRVALILSTVAGVGFSLEYNRTLMRLRQDHADLHDQVGLLEIEDAAKVSIAFVPFSEDDIPPGIEEAHAWRYRLYLPANYGPCYLTQRGLITADSPQGRGGSGSSSHGPRAEPIEVITSIALIKNDNRWIFCRASGGGSSTSYLPEDFQFESLNDLIVETVVSNKREVKTFDANEAVCLFRLRERELAKKRNGEPEDGLYRGFSFYLHSTKQKDAFRDWASGKTEQMEVVQ